MAIFLNVFWFIWHEYRWCFQRYVRKFISLMFWNQNIHLNQLQQLRSKLLSPLNFLPLSFYQILHTFHLFFTSSHDALTHNTSVPIIFSPIINKSCTFNVHKIVIFFEKIDYHYLKINSSCQIHIAKASNIC